MSDDSYKDNQSRESMSKPKENHPKRVEFESILNLSKDDPFEQSPKKNKLRIQCVDYPDIK